MKKMFNEGYQIHTFMFSSGSGTVINYGSGSGSDFLTSYSSLGRYVFGSEISYNKAPPRLPGLGC
jgi:hypothetical protein